MPFSLLYACSYCMILHILIKLRYIASKYNVVKGLKKLLVLQFDFLDFDAKKSTKNEFLPIFSNLVYSIGYCK